ncbi:hypothetical protein PPERSA_08085 [Pseudocohnilembus persalinus]|uniref:RING-type domain-containing protein n=1 Tax=Pseudocohnilembus persalinus TaxID=266149 RepID=A0A0V0R2P1_PSEPJ|nr:hypothetical protein PPERSA_08085 [Pseudocohnilembus persalinus]|eukprot:KRX08774.1 hypothetical protein PPERSA_08085 [Pseudocohnilembus persalinus]
MIPPKQNKTLEEKVAMQLVCIGYIWLLISIGSFITFLIIIFYYVPKSLLKSKLVSESNDDGVRAQQMNYDKYLDKYQNIQTSCEHIQNHDDLIQDKISYKSFFPFKKKKIQKQNHSIKKDVVKEQLEQQLLQKNYSSDKGYNIQKQISESELYINKQIYKQSYGSEVNNLCSICLEIFEKDNKIIQLPCHYKHIFHQKCIKNWWKTLQACPICRSQFKGEYFFGNSIFPKQRLKQLRYCLAIQIDLLASKAL